MHVTHATLAALGLGLVLAAGRAEGQSGTSAKAASAAASTAPVELTISRAPSPPVIDGALDDAAWAAGRLTLGEWISYQPNPGDRIPHTTEVFVVYDRDALYIAFRCHDPEPGKIKSGIRRRDSLFADDWVGLSLDSLGTRQTSFDMFINPVGMQADILTSSASGESIAPDWVWESAGRRTATGYEVEVRLPWQSLRFAGGSSVRMGVMFWRRVSRLGVSVSWPSIEPGRSIFERHATLLLADLDDRRTREAVPSFTSSASQQRESPQRFGGFDAVQDVGVSVKYGLTSAVTIEGTVNPDFSQVESDAFQVEVNQRFPLFFSEKRPFFMEGTDIFAVAGTFGDQSLVRAVHTRRIVDPVAGMKVTGTLGRVAFGALSAIDQAPGRRAIDGPPNPFEDKERYFHIGRVQYGLGPGNYVGAIAASTLFAGGSNHVGGIDATMRIDAHQRISGAVLYTATSPHDGPADKRGALAQASYVYEHRRFIVLGLAEHVDRDFQMDTAFYNQTGITRGWTFAQYNVFPDVKRHPWLRRISPFVFTQGGRDRVQNGTELLIVPGVRFNFTRQGFLRIDRLMGHEPWLGQEFDRATNRIFGEVQIFRWLSVDGSFRVGHATFYDPVAPYLGDQTLASLGFTFEPTPRLSQNVSYTNVKFDRADSGANVYEVDIVNTRTIYQFTKEFYLRAILQYNGDRRRVLTDFLASYELRPGSVVYGGYGALVEQQAFEDGAWIPGRGDYVTTRRGLFFKASYLFRF